MELRYSAEQEMLRESVSGSLADASRDDADTLWRRGAAQGWLALPLPEEDGGLGLGMIEVGIVCEAIGLALTRLPYVTRAVLCATIVARLADDSRRGTLLPRLAEGDLRLALAHEEPGTRSRLDRVGTRAERRDGGWRLDGAKPLIADGGDADLFLVTARLDSGIALFLVPPDAAGLRSETVPACDGSQFASLAFDAFMLPDYALLASGEAVADALAEARDRAIVALSFELAGLMGALLAATLEHCRTRNQFGRPLAANQIVRHRLAGMWIATEEVRNLAIRAALLLDAGHRDARAAASGAKAKAGTAARQLAHDAIQLHGAMGVTDELPIGRHLRRILAIEPLLGSSSHHLARRAACPPSTGLA